MRGATAVAIAVAALYSPAVATRLHQRLGAWYDAVDGVGTPCGDRSPVELIGPTGAIRFNSPRCWTGQAVGFDPLIDPGLPAAPVVIAVTTSAAGHAWTEETLEAAARATRPGAIIRELADRRVVANVYRERRPDAAFTYHAWYVTFADRIVSVTWRVPASLARDARVRESLRATEALVDSLSVPPPATP